MVLITTWMIVRRGAFDPRVVVELRHDLRETSASFAVVAGCEVASTEVSLDLPEGTQHLRAATGTVADLPGLRRASFKIPSGLAGEIKVWAHRITQEGQSEGLPAVLEQKCDSESREFDLRLNGGQTVQPLPGGGCSLEIKLGECP